MASYPNPKLIRDVKRAAAEGAELGKIIADHHKPKVPKIVTVKDFLAAACQPKR